MQLFCEKTYTFLSGSISFDYFSSIRLTLKHDWKNGKNFYEEVLERGKGLLLDLKPWLNFGWEESGNKINQGQVFHGVYNTEKLG